MPKTKASSLRWQDRLVGMSHLRSVALYPNRQFLSDQLVWFLTLSYIQGKFDLFLFIFVAPLPLLFSSSTVKSQQPNARCSLPPVLWKLNPPSVPLSHSPLFFLSLVFMQAAFASGSLCFPRDSASPLNRTIIYLFMYNVKWMQHFFMEQTFRTLTSD